MDSDEMEGCTHGIRECKLYTITDTAKLLGVTRQTVASLIKLKQLKAMDISGRNPRIIGKYIIEFLKQ